MLNCLVGYSYTPYFYANMRIYSQARSIVKLCGPRNVTSPYLYIRLHPKNWLSDLPKKLDTKSN